MGTQILNFRFHSYCIIFHMLWTSFKNVSNARKSEIQIRFFVRSLLCSVLLLHIRLPVCALVCLSVSPFVRLVICAFVRLSVHTHTCSSVRLFACLLVLQISRTLDRSSMFVCPSIHPFIHVFIFYSFIRSSIF